jgi:cellulase
VYLRIPQVHLRHHQHHGTNFRAPPLAPRGPSLRPHIHLGMSPKSPITIPQLPNTCKGVFVNGVDQGTSRGIRTPAYNGQSAKGGYNNSPVKDLDSIDMRCNVLGDIPAHDTIKVLPGDNLTLDWHHELRNDTDEVIASSHHGPSLIYISPDPPTESSFVKIWHEGKYSTPPFPAAGKWSTTSDIAKNFGHMNVRIPEGLRAGHYLIRAEMIGLHEGDVSYKANPKRGAQFYPDCVQIEVMGEGAVELPEGVSFPGAYSYEDPGVVHNVSSLLVLSYSLILLHPYISSPSSFFRNYANLR